MKKKADEQFDAMLKKAQNEGMKRQPQTLEKFKTLVEKLKENKEKLEAASKSKK